MGTVPPFFFRRGRRWCARRGIESPPCYDRAGFEVDRAVASIGGPPAQ